MRRQLLKILDQRNTQRALIMMFLAIVLGVGALTFRDKKAMFAKRTVSETDKISRRSDRLNGSMVSPSSRHHIANVILQISAIVAAIAFDAFAVQSVHLANRANQYAAAATNLSLASNQMAMYAICISSQLQVRCTRG